MTFLEMFKQIRYDFTYRHGKVDIMHDMKTNYLIKEYV